MSANNDKRIQSIDSIETYASVTSKEMVYKKECIKCNNIKECKNSSVKWSDSGRFLKAQVNFFLSFLCILFFTYFWRLKITNRAFKKFPGPLHFTVLSFLQYLNNYFGQLILNQYIISKYLFRSTNLKPMYMFRRA